MDDLLLFGALACLIFGAALSIFFQPQAFARLRGWATEKRERHTGQRTTNLPIPPRHTLRCVASDGDRATPTTGVVLSFRLMSTEMRWRKRKLSNHLHVVASGTKDGWIRTARGGARQGKASPLKVTVFGKGGFLIIKADNGLCFFVRYEEAFEPLRITLDVSLMEGSEDEDGTYSLHFPNHCTLWVVRNESGVILKLFDSRGQFWHSRADNKDAMEELHQLLVATNPRDVLAELMDPPFA